MINIVEIYISLRMLIKKTRCHVYTILKNKDYPCARRHSLLDYCKYNQTRICPSKVHTLSTVRRLLGKLGRSTIHTAKILFFFWIVCLCAHRHRQLHASIRNNLPFTTVESVQELFIRFWLTMHNSSDQF